MKKTSLSALVAAGLLAGAATSASAADLGGNCCADLEERIAELEATTVRKGNRKVSLTISGWVAEQLTYFDDRHESNAYVTSFGSTGLSTNFKFTGSAKITSDVSAGFVLYIEASSRGETLLALNQNTDTAGGGLRVYESYWYLKSNELGKVSLGQQSPPTDNLALLTDGSGSVLQANWVIYEGAGFFLRNGSAAFNAANNGAAGLKWADLANCYSVSAFAGNVSGAGIGGDCTGGPINSVKYVSPTFAGFSISASWGEDKFWDIAGNYAGEWSGFKIAAAIGYSEDTDTTFVAGGDFNQAKYTQLQVGGYLQHIATGLFVHGAYLREELSGIVGAHAFLNSINPDRWYVKGGIRQKWIPFGHTILYGEYSEGNDQLSVAAFDAGIRGTNQRFWGVGAVQEIDAAAMSVWLKYRNQDGSFTGNANAGLGIAAGKTELDNLQTVSFGALINF